MDRGAFDKHDAGRLKGYGEPPIRLAIGQAVNMAEPVPPGIAVGEPVPACATNAHRARHNLSLALRDLAADPTLGPTHRSLRQYGLRFVEHTCYRDIRQLNRRKR